MINRFRTTGILFLLASPLFGQPAPLPEPTAAPMPSIAAVINGQPIYETAVERGLMSVPQDERAKARGEHLEFLVNNVIVDQYLNALKVTVEPAAIEQHLNTFKEEVKKSEQDYAVILKRMKLTEAELKEQIYQLLRWEKFVSQQASDEKLLALFNHMPEAFDGSTIRTRHILLSPGEDPKAKQDAVAKLREIKAQIEKDLAAGLAKLPADTDSVTREQKRQALVDDAFSNAARLNSTCNSKAEGGDLQRWFPRFGSLPESFAKTAYALKPFEISDVVATSVGYHLILVIGRKPGTPTKFEDAGVKEAVKEVYEAKLKDAIVDQMKPRAKIEIMK